MDRFDSSGSRGADNRVHLHGFKSDHFFSGLDVCAYGDIQRNDFTSQGAGDVARLSWNGRGLRGRGGNGCTSSGGPGWAGACGGSDRHRLPLAKDFSNNLVGLTVQCNAELFFHFE
jgi:hypothetical protein